MAGSPSLFRPRKLKAVILASALCYCQTADAAELHPETLRAWRQYLSLTESRIAAELESSQGFLVQDFLPASDATEARETVSSGRVFVCRMKTRNEEGREIDIPKGMVHHWLGVVRIPGAEVEKVLKWIQSYSNLEEHFKEVEESRLISREGDVFRIFLRISGKRFRTVYYNTEHLVTYRRNGPGRASSKSEATKIAQLEDVGTAMEREKPEGDDSGYMWRWNSYWRFKQEPEGVIVECESISLSRSIPGVFLWLVRPFVKSIPKEALESTLESMRKALAIP